LILDSESFAGSSTVLVLDGGTVSVVDANASLEPTWPDVVCPTEA
jgi:hypothetical protein